MMLDSEKKTEPQNKYLRVLISFIPLTIYVMLGKSSSVDLRTFEPALLSNMGKFSCYTLGDIRWWPLRLLLSLFCLLIYF